MKAKRPILILSAVIVLTVLICCVTALLLSVAGDSMNRTLPDGTVFRVVKISTGNEHSYAMPKAKPWQEFLVDHLPPAFTAGREWWGGGHGSVSIGSIPGTPTLAIFTVCNFVGTNRPSQCMIMTATGDDGNASKQIANGPIAATDGSDRDWTLTCWHLETVPTNSRNLALKFYPAAAFVHSNVAPVAEYSIKNPLYNGGKK